MARLEFLDTFLKVADGLAEPPDPLDDLEDGLDPFAPEWFVKRRRALREGGSRGLREELEGFEPPEGFDAQRWMAQYENGRIPLDAMVEVMPGHYLRPDAAAAFIRMVRAAAADGVRITLTDSYRELDVQRRLAEQKGLYSQGGLAAVPGTSPHGWGIAVDVGEGEQRTWLAQHADEYGFRTIPREPWHWEYTGGGEPPMTSSSPAATPQDVERGRHRTVLPFAEQTQARSALLIDDLILGGPPPFGAVLAALLQSERAPASPRVRRVERARRGAGSVKQQLYQGFMDAGRPDLARMVYTRDFDTWIRAESGWRVDAVSPSFPGHGRNYGLFQFWEGHPWTRKYLNGPTTWTADAYTQARLVAAFFPHLTPERIRAYAAQIRAGQYGGWG